MSRTLGVGSGSLQESSSSYSYSRCGELDQFEFPSVIPPTLFPYQSSVGGYQPTNPSAGEDEEEESLISFPEASLVLSNAGFRQAIYQHDEILATRRRWNNHRNSMGWDTNHDGMEMMELCQSPDISVVRMDDYYSTSISPMSSPGSSYHMGRYNMVSSRRPTATRAKLDAPVPASILTYELRNQRLGVGSSSSKTEAEEDTKKNGCNDLVSSGRSLLSQILDENDNNNQSPEINLTVPENTDNHQQEDPSPVTIDSLGERPISDDDYNLQVQTIDQQQKQEEGRWSERHHYHHHSRERNMALTSQDFDVRILLPLLQLEEEVLGELKATTM